MIELFVETYPVDVDLSFSTLLTYCIDDIRDFGAKNTTFSKTIILPGTKRNNALFGNIFEVSGGNEYQPSLPNRGVNFNAAVSASAYIFSDNIQIFKGVVRVLEVIVHDGFIEYEVSVFGELGGFAASLGAKKLTGNENTTYNLDFSAYDQVYSVANIVASWNTAGAGEGIYYPLIDYGNYSPLKHDWIYKTFRPALYAKEYIDKIFEMSGYTYDCDLFNTDRFKSLIIPHGKKAAQQLSNPFFTASSAGQTYLNTPDVHTADFIFSPISENGFLQSGAEVEYIASSPIFADITFNVSGVKHRINGSLQDTFSFDIYRNSTILQTQSFTYSIKGDYPFSLSFSLPGIAITTGDVIHVVVRSLAGPNTVLEYVTSSFAISSTSVALTDIALGDDLVVNTNLPQNILQKDFFSSICKLFNLYVFEDPENDRLLNIKPFVDFFADATAIDWSLKLDRSKPIRIKPMSELNARYYEFKFKDDSDYFNDLYKKRYNQSYGSLIYDSEYEFAKETEKIEVIFSGTPLVGYTGEDKIYSSIFKRTGDVVGDGEENIDSNIRLLQAKKIIGVASWNIFAANGSTILSSQTSYGYAGHLDDPDAPANDIQFGVPKEVFFDLAIAALNINQFNVYWSSYMAEITDKDSKLLTGTFKLDFKDIYNLDFSKLIWIDGVLFRLNKIQDFNATNEDTCECQLLKVINKIY